ncbi:MAG TPA: divergent PAP2 family protein [Candidatus Saccharimonadales bacterium]|nr:divergent PAP2 family protein [Candidatus Saccharimonadales bacterium]
MALPHSLNEEALSPLWVAVSIGVLVQVFKFVASSVAKRRLDFRRLFATGGMPSSHSAGVAALSTAVGLREGFGSVLFAVTVYFSLIVMYDAAGLRRAAGRQATLLNRLIDSHYRHDKHLVEMRLLELLGHTPLEVLAGALVGVGFTLVWFLLGGPNR